MKTYVAAAGGLQLTDAPDPTPGPGQALVRMKAYSLNYRDYAGLAHGAGIPLSDGAGEVVAVGAGVTRVKAGDRVIGNFFAGWVDGPPSAAGNATALGGAIDGVFRELMPYAADSLVILPDGLSYEEGATLPCAGLTAWNALVRDGNLQAGETVLVMGTGGVSVFAVQIAKALGATVIATSSSDAKLARVQALGADVGINYQARPDWENAVLEATGGRGVDHVVEVGGLGTLNQSVQAVRHGGHVALVGILDGFEKPFDQVGPVLHKAIKIQGVYVGSRTELEAFAAFVAAHGIKPVIGETFGFDDAEAAFRTMGAGRHFGKIVVRGT